MGKGKTQQPQIQQISLTPEQEQLNKLFSSIQVPYAQSQYKLFQDIFEPQTRSLGGMLGQDLSQPMTLPEETWSNIWQKSRERTLGEFAPIEQRATERFYGNQTPEGAREKYFSGLDIQKAKSIEDLAINQAIQEWSEKKVAKQQAIENQLRFLGYQPSFNITPQVPQYYSSMPQGSNYSGLGAGIGSVLGGVGGGLTALALPGSQAFLVPMGASMGGALGSGIGGLW